MVELKIELLGGFRVSINGRAINERAWRHHKALSLIKLLALAQGYRIHREQLMEWLWPEADPEAAANSLRQVLFQARKSLEDPASTGVRYIQQEGSWVELRAEGGVWVDVQAFETSASIARNIKSTEAYRAALEVYKGELLPMDIYEDWAASRRESLHQLYLTLLLELAGLYDSQGEIRLAIDTLKHAVTLEPVREEAQIDLMRLYALVGWRFQAIRQYEQLKEMLRQELDVEPAESSQKLYQEILDGSFPPSIIPLKPVEETSIKAQPSHNLPNLLTSFIGREKELSEVKNLLSHARLFTLMGAGGSGKTRLALQVASQLVDDYPDGVWFVELAGLRDPALVSRQVVTTLGVAEQPTQENTETLVNYLRSKRLLLVLDNCEHVLKGCTDLSIVLLKRCPGLQILANSRQTLGVIGETLWPLVGLTLPPSLIAPLHASMRPPALDALREKSEAVRLFIERARLVQPHFELNPENIQAVVTICRDLDGLPLAIELAAARMNVLSPQEIASRLHDRFQLLASRSRDMVDRHQTMRATVDWSYDLLSKAERLLFNRLSVFRGSFTLDAVEVVCADLAGITSSNGTEPVPSSGQSKASKYTGGDIKPAAILDLLTALIEQSMVIAEPSGWTHVRYRLLETLRQYGEERLAQSGSAEVIQRRHANYYQAFAEKAEPELRGREHAIWFGRVEIEHENLRAALHWAFERSESQMDGEIAEIGVRLAQALWWFWYMRGYWGEGRDWYTRCLTLPMAQLPPRLQVRCYVYASLFTLSPADTEQALHLANQGLDLARSCEDEEGAALSLLRKGRMIGRKNPALGTSLLEESLAIFRRLGDPFFIGTAHYYLSYHLGWTFLNAGDFAQATQWLQESLTLAESLGAELGKAIAYSTLGQLARVQGDYERSNDLFVRGLEICRQYGEDYQSSATLANILYGLGQLAFARGNHLQAFAYQKDAIELQQRWGMFTELAMSLEALAIVFTASQKTEKALRLFAAVDAYRQLKGDARTHIDQDEFKHWLSQARADCSESIFEKAWGEGMAMNLEQATLIALDEDTE